MCGIFGYIGDKKSINLLLECLKELLNRGYDSTGISIIKDNSFYLKKYASNNTNNSINLLENSINKDIFFSNGIAHTRWATHGSKTDYNAHPHIDYNNTFSLVHNGIIENYLEIKKELLCNNIIFKSDTDSEVIVNLISFYYNNSKNLDESLCKLSNKLEGTWAIILQKLDEPNKLIILKNGSPLLIGNSNNNYLITSEISGFKNYIKTYYEIKDKSYTIIDINNKIISTNNLKDKKNIEFDNYINSKNGYDYWMEKEIFEQYESSLRALNNGGRLNNNLNVELGGLELKKNELIKYKNVCFLACGTSFYASMYGAIIFKKLNIFQYINNIDASEFYDYSYMNDTLYILLSQSGETKDVHKCMQIIKNNNGFCLTIVNVVESLIARESDCGVYINAGKEKGVASTKSFMNQIIILLLIGCWFSKNISISDQTYCNKILLDLLNLQNNIKYTLNNIVPICKKMANQFKETKHLYILGRSLAYPICLEGALKIKEISYIHAEGYCGGALKHGPFALIETGTSIFILNFRDDNCNLMNSSAEEVKSRGANVILITDDIELYNKDIYSECILLNKMNEISSLCSVIFFQLFSYYLALEKNINPDFPRNLAKVVTVY